MRVMGGVTCFTVREVISALKITLILFFVYDYIIYMFF